MDEKHSQLLAPATFVETCFANDNMQGRERCPKEPGWWNRSTTIKESTGIGGRGKVVAVPAGSCGYEYPSFFLCRQRKETSKVLLLLGGQKPHLAATGSPHNPVSRGAGQVTMPSHLPIDLTNPSPPIRYPMRPLDP